MLHSFLYLLGSSVVSWGVQPQRPSVRQRPWIKDASWQTAWTDPFAKRSCSQTWWVWSKPLVSASLYPVPQLWLHPSECELLGPPFKKHRLQIIRGFSSPASPVLTGQRWVLSRATSYGLSLNLLSSFPRFRIYELLTSPLFVMLGSLLPPN